MKLLLGALFFGWAIRLTTGKSVQLIALRQNRDLPYLSECFGAGQLVPVIDGPHSLDQGSEALRHFGAGHHKGKVVITMGLNGT
jgi:hypothetical protein